MDIQSLVTTWFQKWEEGDFHHIPVSDDFRHISPYGIIEGKEPYIQLVEANKDKFLNHRFEMRDALYEHNRACVRYTSIQDDFVLEVSEWFYTRGGLIGEIVSYYNIEGEISSERELTHPE